MSNDPITPGNTHLTWINVGIGSGFVLFDAVLSQLAGLQVGQALIVAAVRCAVQLALMGTVLKSVFEMEGWGGVVIVAGVLNLMGTFEVVINKSKRRFHHMFSSVLLGMLVSTIPVSIIGTQYAMSVSPFWTPAQYIPIVGMLCGSTISGIVVAVSHVLKELDENGDKVEMYLSFGASRMEACRPIAQEALRLALTPTINQMSVIGIISIPGMMTGAILGGSSVEQAAKLQMVIMFMISASTTLAAIVTTVIALAVVVDGEDRVRRERIDGREHLIWRARGRVVRGIVDGVKSVVWRRRIE